MHRNPILAAFIFCAVLLALNLPSQARGKAPICNQQYKAQKFGPDLHKALATNGGKSPYLSGTICGFGFSYPSIAGAEKRAIAQCEIGKKRWHERGQCIVIDRK